MTVEPQGRGYSITCSCGKTCEYAAASILKRDRMIRRSTVREANKGDKTCAVARKKPGSVTYVVIVIGARVTDQFAITGPEKRAFKTRPVWIFKTKDVKEAVKILADESRPTREPTKMVTSPTEFIREEIGYTTKPAEFGKETR